MKKKKKFISDLELQEAIRLYNEEELNTIQIAPIFNVSTSSIIKNFKVKGVVIRPHKVSTKSRILMSKIKKEQIRDGRFTPYRKEKGLPFKSIIFNDKKINDIIDLYTNKKYSTYKIAEMFCCGASCISNILKVNKVPIRGITGHTEESRRKMSETKKRLFKEGKIKIDKSVSEKGVLRLKQLIKEGKVNFKKTNTSIEVKIQNFLKELNIDFFTHQYIKEIEHGYLCDIFIPSMNLVIECDGDYWHGNPISFINSKPNEKVLRKMELDKIRNVELNNAGFNLLRLWENKIREMDINEFESLLVNNVSDSFGRR